MNGPSAPVPDENTEGPDPVVFSVTAALVVSERPPESKPFQLRLGMELQGAGMNDAMSRSSAFAGKGAGPDRPARGDSRPDAEIACGRFEPLKPEKILCHLWSLIFRGKMDRNGNGFGCKNQPGGLKISRIVPIMKSQEL